MKYKVGDKVRIYNVTDHRRDYNGTVVTIRSINPNGKTSYKSNITHYGVKEKNIGFVFWEDELVSVPVNTRKIVITSDGVETLARLYDGNKVIKSATAKCSPDDTFDFEVGAKLAYDRLMTKSPAEVFCKNFAEGTKKASEALKKLADALDKKTPDPAEKKWRVVSRPATVGDYIRIKGEPFSFNRDGEILKVDKVGNVVVSVYGKNHERDTGDANCLWNYWTAEYEVVEPVVYKAGDKVKVIGNTCWHSMKTGEVVTLDRIFDKGTSPAWFVKEYNTVCYIRECDFEPYAEPEKPKYYNGKVVCTGATAPWAAYTVGKVYKFKDGRVKIDNGNTVPSRHEKPVKSLDEWNYNKNNLGKFIPFVE